jgi:hypothetical protein
MKYLSGRFFKFILVYVAIIFALSITHWDGAGILLKSSLAEAAGPAIGFTIDNPGIRKAIEVQNRHKEQLLSLPGVVGVGTGIGANGQPIIRVFTKRAGIPNIPQKIEEIPVKMKVTGMFVAYTDPTARFDRPVPIGVSTGHPDITAGTIGCRVTDGTNVYALSNNHVYANANNASIGDPALQPGTYDGGDYPADQIGTLARYKPIDFSVFGSNTIDAAIVLTTPYEVGNATPPDGYGTPAKDIVNATINLPVKKYGRTTGLTHGQVTEINVTSAVCYDKCSHPFRAKLAWFDNQIAIESVSNDAFSMGGDSGSLIVTDDQSKNPVGLLFAGSSTTTLANRIDLVLNHFDVSVDDSSTTPSQNHSPNVSITSPTDGASFNSGESISFAGTASDDEDGVLTSSLIWRSDLDDEIGTGGSFSAVLSDGLHTITAEVTDNDGAISSASRNVTVSSGSVADITLTASGKQNKKWTIINLNWSGAISGNVYIFLNDVHIVTTTNDGTYTDKLSSENSGPYTYKVCEEGSTSACSDPTPVTF